MPKIKGSKRYDFLTRIGLIDAENYVLDKNGKHYIDPYTDLKINYEYAVFINDNLYNAISLYIAVSIRERNKVDYYNRRISVQEYNSVKKIYDSMDLVDLDDLRDYRDYFYVLYIYYKQIEKKVRGISEHNINFDDIEYINDLITSFYENLIKNNHIFNRMRHNILYFNNTIEIIIYYLRIINKLEDRKRLIYYPLVVIIDILNNIFKELNHEYKEIIQYYYNLYLYTTHFNKYLDRTNFSIFLDFCLSLLSFLKDENSDLFLIEQRSNSYKLNLLKRGIANELANEFIQICENDNIDDIDDIDDIDVLMMFLDNFNKSLSFSLPIIKENENILKILAIYLIKRSFGIIKSSNKPSVAIEFIKKTGEIAYLLSFKEDMKDVFEDVYNKHTQNLFRALSSFKVNFYDKIFEFQTNGGIFNKEKALKNARDKIKKEYDDFIKNLLKAYENILKIYILSFMSDINRDKLHELHYNVYKCYRKLTQNFNIAEKAFTTYDKNRKSTYGEIVAKGISSIFSRKRVAPAENSRSNISPIESITISEPEIPSLSRKSLRALPRRKKTN